MAPNALALEVVRVLRKPDGSSTRLPLRPTAFRFRGHHRIRLNGFWHGLGGSAVAVEAEALVPLLLRRTCWSEYTGTRTSRGRSSRRTSSSTTRSKGSFNMNSRWCEGLLN